MGSGKTTVGRQLAELLDVPFQDTDRLLENRLGRPVRQWFQIYGEEAFREHETLMLQGLEPDDGVLATGGGIVLREENWKEMNRLGITIYLDVEPEILKERLTNTKRKRPLLEFPDWEDRFYHILDSRKHLYQRADIVVPVGNEELSDVAKKIAKSIGEL